MGVTSFSLLLLLAVLATATIYILVSRRKRQRAQEEDDRLKAKLEAWRTAENDKRQRLAATLRRTEENLQKADEECRKAEEGRQQLEELARREAEETERTGQEEVERRAQEEALRKVQEERQTSEPKGDRPDPLKRGGRPRASPKDRDKRALEEIGHRRPKPEIVCWKREREWIPGIEIPDELLAISVPEVRQNSSLLTQDESNEALWRLADVGGQVVVCWNEDRGQPEARLSLEEKCLIYKLSAQTRNQGRRIRFPSSGTYLVVAPNDWERDDALSGPPQWAPEAVSLPGYRAHYYSLSRNASRKIAFHNPLGERVVIEPEAPRFELVATQLNDPTEDVAPLYGGKPPRIKASDVRGWTGVGTIVIGEEGGGPQRWRMEFYPSVDMVEQEMPPQVAARNGGWYFLRFYDANEDLLESLDFMFLSALKEIRTAQQSPLPSAGGHTPVLVEIVCERTLSIQPGDEPASKIQVERENGKVMLRILPDPAFDVTRWLMGIEGGPHLEVAILVGRLWWAVSDEDDPPSKWEDSPLSFSRGVFSATSKEALWVKLPRRRWVDKIFAGFVQSKARSFPVKVVERELAIPFREFASSQELQDESQTHVLKLWVSDYDGFAVGIIPSAFQSRPSEAPDEVEISSPVGRWWIGHGRYKTAIVKVILREGTGEIRVNGQPAEDYFKVTPREGMDFLRRLLAMSQVAELLARKDALIVVNGSSRTSVRQAHAVAHALARALMSCDVNLRPSLRRAGFGGVTVTNLASVTGVVV